MNKGIVVIDMPKTCFECPFWHDGEKVWTGRYEYRQLHNCSLTPNKHIGECLEDHVKDIMIGKPEWCPIRPVPERADHKDHCDNGRYDNGWNDCLDKIMEE